MNKYIVEDPWRIIERGYDASLHPISESLFSIGNGRLGQRANFEESYSGESLRGSYIAGVYYPDKTRVGWWKNGYPEYFAKVLNSVNWIGVKLYINNEEIDLHRQRVRQFERVLDMRTGILERHVVISLAGGLEVTIASNRFYSLHDQNWAFMEYQVSANQEVSVRLESYLDFNVRNADANYDDDFWHKRQQKIEDGILHTLATTKKTEFTVCAALINKVTLGNSLLSSAHDTCIEGYVSETYALNLTADTILSLTKNIAIHSTFYTPIEELSTLSIQSVRQALNTGMAYCTSRQSEIWSERWNVCDINIAGDTAAQQGIRFNIFQLYQTYSGEDPRLNIGPKGFTGEKYGGSTYWDTEAYCLPFYMCIAPPQVAHSLLVYRYNHLDKAIENAGKLGFTDGAALYPMVTMNGEECHNEWEITFEEIHRNGAIAYAIYDYIRYTDDKEYLATHGLEVLIGIARFWSQRTNFSEDRRQYVILGVTGPNEYENNVNNNWYTNYIARWCLHYTIDCMKYVKNDHPEKWATMAVKCMWKETETLRWDDIISNMYLPYDPQRRIFLQQDGFLDKDLITTEELDPAQRPLNQKWSWDRILRSVFIKQADVLQGLYFFEDDFSMAEHRINFDFYEPRTVHESSLSPCVHAILASKLAYRDKAYEMYLRTARLDLDNYNNDTEDGCHITSMAGTWLSIVKGFGGMRYDKNGISFSPALPAQWDDLSFKVVYRDSILKIIASRNSCEIEHLSGANTLDIKVYDKTYSLKPNNILRIPRQ